ncbi:hypothetical protein ICNINCKA_03018 [Synechococcus sp. CBW1107]|nr:hypothetical protein ICNINCKA_03018 [Synechococcus sp. CBW1107]
MHVGHLQGLEQQAVGTGEIGSALTAYRSGEVHGVELPVPVTRELEDKLTEWCWRYR